MCLSMPRTRRAAVTAERVAARVLAHAGGVARAVDARAQILAPPWGRIDSVYGDRNLVCSCVPMEAYED